MKTMKFTRDTEVQKTGYSRFSKTVLLLVAVLILAGITGCGNDATAPQELSAETASRSPHWELESWENLKLTWASLRWSETTASFQARVLGSILLRDIAYAKEVTIVYTTDNWQSWDEISAYYVSDAGNNCEYWRFASPEYSFAKAHPTESITEAVDLDFDFAIRYRVSGNTWWDNNGGKNYHIDGTYRYISN